MLLHPHIVGPWWSCRRELFYFFIFFCCTDVILLCSPNSCMVFCLPGAAPFVPIVSPICSKLEKLSVVGTKISNATLSWISRSAVQLKCLNLSFSHGYDEDLVKSFPRLFPHLQNLYLSNTRLTEEALVVLANLYSLRVLDISNNLQLTPEAILAFRKMTSNRISLILERPIDSVKYCCW